MMENKTSPDIAIEGLSNAVFCLSNKMFINQSVIPHGSITTSPTFQNQILFEFKINMLTALLNKDENSKKELKQKMVNWYMKNHGFYEEDKQKVIDFVEKESILF